MTGTAAAFWCRCKLGHLEYQVSANSFFQVNSRQCAALYRTVSALAEVRATDTVLDLYCGAGTIGLWLARECKQVVGIELSEAAVADARSNAWRNGIKNAEFRQADLVDSGLNVTKTAHPEVVVVDPARAGLADAVMLFLKRIKPRKVVYVSCNADSLARDLGVLCGGSGAGGLGPSPFVLSSVTPVDMFPQTDHLEVVAVLDLAR